MYKEQLLEKEFVVEQTIDNKMAENKSLLIIEGVRENGTKFRPSDWPERLSSAFAGFGKDHRLKYAPGVRPCMFEGQKVLVVNLSLQQQDPSTFDQIMKFASDNNLRIRKV